MTMPAQQFFLTTPPDRCREAAACGVPVAHAAYRIGNGGRLYRAELPVNLRGGLMVLASAGFHGTGDPVQLGRDVVRECTARKFDGILCDFDGLPTAFLEKAVAVLGELAAQRGWGLYVTEPYAGAWGGSVVLIPTAISAGSLEARLRERVERYGAGRVALAMQRTAREFRLPAGTGEGRTLERAELAERVNRFGPAVFFDRNLCAHYFTYMEGGAAHFVLFDDSGSLLRKAELAQTLGIRKLFFAYPEVEDILPRLLAE